MTIILGSWIDYQKYTKKGSWISVAWVDLDMMDIWTAHIEPVLLKLTRNKALGSMLGGLYNLVANQDWIN